MRRTRAGRRAPPPGDRLSYVGTRFCAQTSRSHARVAVEARREKDARVDARAIGADALVPVEQRRHQAAHLVRTAPGEDRDRGGVRRHSERPPRGFARQHRALEGGVADVTRVDPRVAPERDLEGQHERHPVDLVAERRGAARSPGPDLGSDVPEDAHAGGAEARREARVELGVVDEERRLGRRCFTAFITARHAATTCHVRATASPTPSAVDARRSLATSTARPASAGPPSPKARTPSSRPTTAAAARSPDASPATTSSDVTAARPRRGRRGRWPRRPAAPGTRRSRRPGTARRRSSPRRRRRP